MITSFLYRNRCFAQPSYSFRQEDTDGDAKRCQAFIIQALFELPRRSCETGCPLSAYEWALSPSSTVPSALFTFYPVYYCCHCARFSVDLLNSSTSHFSPLISRGRPVNPPTSLLGQLYCIGWALTWMFVWKLLSFVGFKPASLIPRLLDPEVCSRSQKDNE
jgi:hypothetical protein